MTQEEKQEEQGKREIYAGIALPGLIMRYAGTYMNNDDIAKQAFDLAEAMIEEGKRIEKLNEEEE